MHSFHRNLPYSEESQHMIYAVSIKEFVHVLKATYPPLAAIFQHLIPVISGESPILSVHRKVIWWCTCLPVEVEILWFHPHVTSITIDADRDVSLQNDPFLTCIGMYCFHLFIENKLHKIKESHLFIFFRCWC